MGIRERNRRNRRENPGVESFVYEKMETLRCLKMSEPLGWNQSSHLSSS
jgi:hypothetical protein